MLSYILRLMCLFPMLWLSKFRRTIADDRPRISRTVSPRILPIISLGNTLPLPIPTPLGPLLSTLHSPEYHSSLPNHPLHSLKHSAMPKLPLPQLRKHTQPEQEQQQVQARSTNPSPTGVPCSSSSVEDDAAQQSIIMRNLHVCSRIEEGIRMSELSYERQ